MNMLSNVPGEQTADDKFIVFITGASGVGKTTLLDNLKEKYSHKPDWEFLKFDSIGVPPDEEMVREYGSGENWQREKTFEWIQKMVCGFPDKKLIVLDGQANLQFIRAGFERQKFFNYQIILLDCAQETVIHRLIEERQQPWLASEQMKNWLKFLRDQAEQFRQPVINTAQNSPDEVVGQFEQILSTR